MTLAPDDSLLAARRVAPDTLEVERLSASGTFATTRAYIPAPYLEKIAAAHPSVATPASSRTPLLHVAETTAVEPNKARIREDYMGGQLGVSAYLYGVALPSVVELESRASVLLPAFLITGSLAAHAIYSLNVPVTQAEVLGMNYVSAGSVMASYAGVYALRGSGSGTFDAGSVIALATYPVSLVPGYRLGARYNDAPGILYKRVASAGIFGGTGLILPWVYYESPARDTYLRLSAAQFLAFGVAGHWIGDLYRPGEALSDGVTTGIFTHMGFGTLVGSALAVSLEPDDSRVVTGVILGSSLAGLAEGLWFFHDRNDDAEKANYAGFGTLGGMLLTGSVAWAASASAEGTMWLLAGGALGGYTIVYRGLSQREQREERSPRRASRSSGGSSSSGFVKDVSLSLAPVAESGRVSPDDPRAARGGYTTRYRVPGITFRF